MHSLTKEEEREISRKATIISAIFTVAIGILALLWIF